MLVAMMSLASALAFHSATAVSPPFAQDAFKRTWQRTDKPVADGQVDRTWIWGPQPYTYGALEDYTEAPQGRREVQYFDKSRMEINNPSGDQSSPWYVTNGLLVNELISGMMQVGDADFVPKEPADINVAGDPDDPDAVTYADLAGVLHDQAAYVGEALTKRIDDHGIVSVDPTLAAAGITAGYRVTVPGIDHTIASPFWDFMNSTGIVSIDGQTESDALFVNPFYATGFPVTEAYWANVDVAGADHLVLLQCFERRCLTYTPSNASGWQVEFGNVGQHYHRWRYGETGPTEEAQIYLVALGGGAPSGQAIGCGDELAPVTVNIPLADSTEGKITNALTVLFGLHDQFYGESGLYNALYQSNLTVAHVGIAGGIATVDLSGQLQLGGECDDPRAEAQLRSTVLQFAGVIDVAFTLNGEPLWGQPSGQEYDVLFGSLNGSGVNGAAHLSLSGDQLTVHIQATGLEPDQEHMAHIHGNDGGQPAASCPTPAAAGDDGIISLEEGAPSYGDVKVAITDGNDMYPMSDEDGAVDFSATYTIDPATFGPLENHVIVLHGMTTSFDQDDDGVTDEYEPLLPVACGAIFPTANPPVASHYRVDLLAINASGAGGTVDLTLAGDVLTVSADLSGLAMHLAHPIHIHGLADGISTCPTAAYDTDADGIIELAEGTPAYGDVLLDVEPMPVADHEATATIEQSYIVDPATLGPLDDRAIVIHGMVVPVDGEPHYDASVPIACGIVRENGVNEFHASLNGNNQVPPVESAAGATFIARLNQAGDTLSWQIAIHGFSEDDGPTAASIWQGAAGETGPHIATLWFTESTPPTTDGQLWSGKLTSADLAGADLTLDDVIDLFNSGGAYIQINTTAHPDGELRGQVTPYT